MGKLIFIFFKLQTPASFAQSVQELTIALQRTGDPANLNRLRPHLELLANIDPSPGKPKGDWWTLLCVRPCLSVFFKSFLLPPPGISQSGYSRFLLQYWSFWSQACPSVPLLLPLTFVQYLLPCRSLRRRRSPPASCVSLSLPGPAGFYSSHLFWQNSSFLIVFKSCV